MKALAVLAAGALATMEILDEMAPVGFTRSYYQNRKRAYKDRSGNLEIQKFYNTLHYLKSEGFIEKKISGAKILWKITSSGLYKLNLMKEKATNYQSEPDGKLKIIIFDVPEKERRRRSWLREALKILGFKMLQQSVWMGKNKIPEQFLFDLRQKKLLPYIHILEVNKGGTIRELV